MSRIGQLPENAPNGAVNFSASIRSLARMSDRRGLLGYLRNCRQGLERSRLYMHQYSIAQSP